MLARSEMQRSPRSAAVVGVADGAGGWAKDGGSVALFQRIDGLGGAARHWPMALPAASCWAHRAEGCGTPGSSTACVVSVGGDGTMRSATSGTAVSSLEGARGAPGARMYAALSTVPSSLQRPAERPRTSMRACRFRCCPATSLSPGGGLFDNVRTRRSRVAAAAGEPDERLLREAAVRRTGRGSDQGRTSAGQNSDRARRTGAVGPFGEGACGGLSLPRR